MFSLFRKFAKDAKVNEVKREMNQALAHDQRKRSELKETLEKNGITLYIVRAMGGKGGH